MKDTKSLRVDGLPPKLLMETVEQIRITIARVFKLKKGSINKSDNYRPVSLTPVICKLLEMLIKDLMLDFFVRK